MNRGKTAIILGTVILAAGGFDSLAAAEEAATDINFSLEDYSFTMEGDTFTLPMKVSDFAEKGWTNFYGLDYDMSGVSVTGETWKKDGKEIFVTLVNFSQDAMPAGECYIGKITVENTAENRPAFETKAGISLGSG